ncbi:MAG: MFS transporter [Candidatus Azobacteroides sp.]|nr:MFS transporter [Candidatus Azobacteroides sp.]
MEQISADTVSKGRIRAAIFCLYFCIGLCFSSWASRIPDIKSALQLNDAGWGTILLMIPIGQICSMTISGLIVSKVGSKKILPLALLCYVVVLLFIGLSATEYSLIMSLIAFGFCGNFCNISVNTQAISLEAVYNKPIMASFHGGWSLAGLAGAAIGLLMASIHLRPIYHFCIVGTLVIATLIINRPYLQPDIKKEKDPADIAARKKRKPETFLFLLGMLAFCSLAAEGAMADWSGLYLIDVVGMPKHLAPMGLAAYMITMASGRFMIDRATQKWGRQRIVQVGGTLIGAGLFTAVIFPHLVPVIIAFMITGFGTAGIIPTLYSAAGQKTRISPSLALTIVSSIGFLGFLMGPPLIGYIATVTNLRYSYTFIAILGICILALASSISVFGKDESLRNEK